MEKRCSILIMMKVSFEPEVLNIPSWSSYGLFTTSYPRSFAFVHTKPPDRTFLSNGALSSKFSRLVKHSASSHYVGSTVGNDHPFTANSDIQAAISIICVELVRTLRTSVEDRRAFVGTPQLDFLELKLWIVALWTLLVDELL